MSSSGRLLGIVGAVLAALAATVLLGFAVGGGLFAQGMGFMLTDAASGVGGRLVFAVLGAGVLAADLWLILRTLGFGGAKVIDFESSSGRMVVDVSALEEALRRSAMEDGDVMDADAHIHVPRGGFARPIVCDIGVGIRERSDVPGRGAEIASKLKRAFLRIIPVETDPVVNLKIRIRPPLPDEEAAKVTQAMSVAEGEKAAEAPLPDVHDFTGERRYGKDEEGEGREAESG